MLLCAGDKRAQSQDIKRARRWRRDSDAENDPI
jgi:putative component of toxin-antitoxin plasmid stabilization module